jgi:hypothetical protein
VAKLHVSGTVQLHDILSNETVVDPDTQFLLGNAELGRIGSSVAQPPTLRFLGSGSIRLGSIPDGSTVVLANGARVELTDRASDASEVLLRGSGYISIGGTLTRPRFEPVTDLVVEVRGSVLDATGEVTVLIANARSVVTGDRDRPVVLKAIREAQSALLEQVDIYNLAIGDLSALETSERFSPWIPAPRKARRLEDAMSLGGGSDETIRVKRAHFWMRVSTMTRDKHAPGVVQSEVRYAAQRARRRSLRFGREWAMLAAYQCLGFGERILRPLLLYAVLTGAVAVVFTADPGHGGLANANFLSIWVSVLASPLAFLRLPSVGTALHPHGPAQQGALFFMRLVGLLLLLLALIAARRLAKAE